MLKFRNKNQAQRNGKRCWALYQKIAGEIFRAGDDARRVDVLWWLMIKLYRARNNYERSATADSGRDVRQALGVRWVRCGICPSLSLINPQACHKSICSRKVTRHHIDIIDLPLAICFKSAAYVLKLQKMCLFLITYIPENINFALKERNH